MMRLKQKNNLQALRDFIIFKEDHQEEHSDIGNDEIIQNIKGLKKYEQTSDDKIFHLNKKRLNFDFDFRW